MVTVHHLILILIHVVCKHVFCDKCSRVTERVFKLAKYVIIISTQKTREDKPMLEWIWPSVAWCAPALIQHRISFSCLVCDAGRSPHTTHKNRPQLNHCRAELFQLYFSSFKAGIANAIPSFKWRKIWLFMRNKHVGKLTFWLTEHLSQTILRISVAFYFLWNSLETGYIRLQQHNGKRSNAHHRSNMNQGHGTV